MRTAPLLYTIQCSRTNSVSLYSTWEVGKENWSWKTKNTRNNSLKTPHPKPHRRIFITMKKEVSPSDNRCKLQAVWGSKDEKRFWPWWQWTYPHLVEFRAWSRQPRTWQKPPKSARSIQTRYSDYRERRWRMRRSSGNPPAVSDSPATSSSCRSSRTSNWVRTFPPWFSSRRMIENCRRLKSQHHTWTVE